MRCDTPRDPWGGIPSEQLRQIRFERLHRRIRNSGLPKRWQRPVSSWHCGANREREKILAAATRWVERFGTDEDEGRNLVFVGATGTGKSHLAASMLYDLAVAGHHVRCEVLSELWGRMRASYSRQDEEALDYLTPLEGAEIVLLDELGSVRPDQPATRWEADTLRDIINAVLRDGQRLIVTTNHDRATLERWLGDMSVSRRIFEDAAVVNGFGALGSYREEIRA